MPKKLTTETFRKQLEVEHPELELLSEYNGNKNYVTVRCKKHDYTFRTKPNWLHGGTGCQKCYDERRGETTRKTTEEFIKEAREIHGDKYDYSKVVYEGNKKKVCIICPEHGEFWQTPNKHLSLGQGCPKCVGRNRSTKDVIEEFRKVHRYDYVYDKVEYVNNRTKVCIICPMHGEFWQTPDVHLRGCGCPMCKSSKLEKNVRNYLLDEGQDFTSQKAFPWLGRQHLDFYLPEYNIAIECQGEQHFKEFTGSLGEKTNLEDRITLDKKKYDLCKENGVRLLYVMPKRYRNISKTENFDGMYDNDEDIIFENKLNKLETILAK